MGGAEQGSLALALLSQSETGLIALDRRLQVALANEAARGLLGTKRCEEPVALRGLLEGASALAPSGVTALMSWLQGGGDEEAVLRRQDGQAIAVRGALGPEGHLLLALRRLPRSAVPAGRRDGLTGLADRAWFEERLGQMLAEPDLRPTVLLIDLDHFRSVNDALGHEAGDAILQVVAKRLAHALREDDVICRLAGDEFAVVMPRASDPEGVARRLADALARPYAVLGRTASVGATVGIARAPEDGGDAEALRRSARIALQAAKAAGSAVRRFDPDAVPAAERRQALAEALRHAVSGHALVLHYQPVVPVDGGAPTGFEALVRWRHGAEGLLGPDAFIPLAEQTGAIWPISDWVLRTACETASDWPLGLTVAVNVSVQQLLDRHRLARSIKSALLRSALAPDRLEVEIPAAALVRGAETLPAVQSVAALGVRITLDDLGPGPESLSQVAAFPCDRVKTARGLLGGAEGGGAAGVLGAVAGLARALGARATAKGVERECGREAARRAGFDSVQGYLVGGPEAAPLAVTCQAT